MGGYIITERINEIMEQAREAIRGGVLTLLLQPIVNLQNGEVLGYEALARGPKDGSVYEASVLTWAVERAGCEKEFCEEVVRLSMKTKAAKLPRGIKVFINLDHVPLDDMDAVLHRHVEEYGIDRSEVVFEITERLWGNTSGLTMLIPKIVRSLQRYGYRVAMDDLATAMDMAIALTNRPDYVKLDMFCVNRIMSNREFREKVSNWVKHFSEVGIKTIAEGVDDWKKVEVLEGMGISYGQGYLIGIPSRDPVE